MSQPDAEPDAISVPDPEKTKYMPTKNLWTTNKILKGALIFMGILLVIAWILMMLAAKELSAARKAGTWSRELCGYEYMEAETERYKLAAAYQKSAKRLIYAALATFIGLGAIAIATMAFFGADIFVTALRKDNTYNDSTKTSALIWGSVLFVVLALLAQVGTLTGRFGEILNQKSYNEAITVEGANDEIKKKNPLLIQSVILGTLASLGLMFLAYNYVATTDKDANGISFPEMPSASYLGLVVLTFVLATTLSLVLTKYYTRLNAWFSDYGTQTNTLNTDLANVMTEEGPTGTTQDYLRRNIKRLDPNADIGVADALTVNYKDLLYAYVFHADGEEMNYLDKKTVRADDAKRIFETLKSELTTLIPNTDIRKEYTDALDAAYVAVLASLTSSVTRPTITTALLQQAVRDALAKVKQTTPIKLNAALRYYLSSLLANDAPIKVAELRNYVKTIVETHAESAVRMTHADIMAAIEKNIIGKVVIGVSGADLDATVIGTSKDDTRRQALLDSFADGRDNGLDDIKLRTTVGAFLADRIGRLVAEVLATTRTKLDFRDKLSALRSSQMTQEADKFIRAIFIASIVIAALFAYGVFHYFYTKAEDFVTLVSAGVILVLVLAMSFYGWFMGQTII